MTDTDEEVNRELLAADVGKALKSLQKLQGRLAALGMQRHASMMNHAVDRLWYVDQLMRSGTYV